MKWIVYSDLDGTLLNHDNYGFDEAAQSLSYLKKQKIPLVIVTSKTFAEVKPLQQKLGIECPFIVENGAGTFISSNSVLAEDILSDEPYIKISNAKSYLELRLFFKHLQSRYKIRGFGDMEVDEVMQLTSLDELSASKAMQRDFTEPFIIEDSVDIEAVTKEANEEGLDVVQGGRFYHLVSAGQSKGEAIKYLTHLFEEHYDTKCKMIALGDSPNDFSMLRVADIGVLIPRYDGSYADIDAPHITKALFAGPKGLNASLLEILDAC